MEPWGEVSKEIIDGLNDLLKENEAFLAKFHEKSIIYIAKNFASLAFLNKHARKLFFEYIILLLESFI